MGGSRSNFGAPAPPADPEFVIGARPLLAPMGPAQPVIAPCLTQPAVRPEHGILGVPAGLGDPSIPMRELLRSNDPVMLSWAEAMLSGAGIDVVVLDLHASVVDGSISAIARRLMVNDEDWTRARKVIDDATPAGG